MSLEQKEVLVVLQVCLAIHKEDVKAVQIGLSVCSSLRQPRGIEVCQVLKPAVDLL